MERKATQSHNRLKDVRDSCGFAFLNKGLTHVILQKKNRA